MRLSNPITSLAPPDEAVKLNDGRSISYRSWLMRERRRLFNKGLPSVIVQSDTSGSIQLVYSSKDHNGADPIKLNNDQLAALARGESLQI